jgi:hypothetical protein
VPTNPQIYQVIKSHRATYLAGSDWTELPWQDSHKTPFDCLLDKTAALANLFVQGLEILELKTTNLLPAGLEPWPVVLATALDGRKPGR